MSRNLTQAMLDELAKNLLRPVFFVEIETASGTVRVWSGIGPKSWNSQTWDGVGSFGGISELPETTEIQAQGIVLTLSGIPNDMAGVALDAARVGKPAHVWFGLLGDTEQVIADPFESYHGRVDAVRLEEGGETSTIALAVESELIRLQLANESRWTDADQQRLFPGDRGFEYVEQLQQLNLSWPGPAQPIPRSQPERTGED